MMDSPAACTMPMDEVHNEVHLVFIYTMMTEFSLPP